MTLHKEEKRTLSLYRLDKARKILADAELLLKEGRAESAINRSYYAALSAAKAALILFGIDPKTHEGVKTMVNKELVMSGRLPREYGKWFRNLLFERENVDYADYISIDLSDAKESFQNASSFIDKINEIIRLLIDEL